MSGTLSPDADEHLVLSLALGPLGNEPEISHAEVTVVGAFFVAQDEDKETLLRTVSRLAPEHFTDDHCRAVFSVCVDLTRAGVPIDVVTVENRLRYAGDEIEVSLDFLASLIDAVPTAANVEWHADIVLDNARRDRLDAIVTASALDLRQGVKPVDEITARLDQQIRTQH